MSQGLNATYRRALCVQAHCTGSMGMTRRRMDSLTFLPHAFDSSYSKYIRYVARTKYSFEMTNSLAFGSVPAPAGE